jgi:hypothetical protein
MYFLLGDLLNKFLCTEIFTFTLRQTLENIFTGILLVLWYMVLLVIWFVVAVLLLLSALGTSTWDKTFWKRQLTLLLILLRLGESFYKEWIPFIGTLFFFVFGCNWAGAVIPWKLIELPQGGLLLRRMILIQRLR